jgi:broad specificity phosphatase PhoE
MPILLIRHGETDSNAARIVQTPDVPLSARGVAQAERLARRLAGAGVAPSCAAICAAPS